MSKSKRNTVDPEPIVDQYGADAVRWFMLSDSPPERDLEWSEAGIEGSWRFVQRLWRLAAEEAERGLDLARRRRGRCARPQAPPDHRRRRRQYRGAGLQQGGRQPLRARQRDREGAALALAKQGGRDLVLLVAPMVPHLAEEAWAALGKEGLIADAEWPEADPALLVEEEVTIAVQVNGKLRDTLTAPKGAPGDARGNGARLRKGGAGCSTASRRAR
jgi:leucyl-tRNA synthetase